MSIDSRSSQLRSLRLKATPKRLAVLDVLERAAIYLSPEEVWESLKARFARLGLPTVYRILEELAEGGLVTKIIHPNRQLYYFFCGNDDHHHHFICLDCRRVEEISHCSAQTIEREVKEHLQGTVLSHIFQVNGLCRRCSRTRRRAKA